MLEIFAALATIIAVPLAIVPWWQQRSADRRATKSAVKKDLLQQKNARIKKMARVLQGINELGRLYAQRVAELENRNWRTVLNEFRRKVEGMDFMSPNTYSDSALDSILHDIEEEEMNQR